MPCTNFKTTYILKMSPKFDIHRRRVGNGKLQNVVSFPTIEYNMDKLMVLHFKINHKKR